MFLTKCLSKCSSSTKPTLPRKISDGATALMHYSFCKTLRLKCLTVFWMRLCLNSCYIQNSAYSDICRYIQTYSASLRHIHAYWDIKVYSAPSVTLAYLQPCGIPSPSIFRTGGIFKTIWNFDQVYTEPCHSHSKLFRHYSGIFRTPCVALAYT